MKESPPAISVVVPCRDHAKELTSCLQALEGQLPARDYEVIVVDSAGDRTVAEAAARFPAVRLVRSESALLAGEARNLGAWHARAPYLAFTDADCVPDPGWLPAALGALQAGAALAGGPVLDVRPLHPIAAADNLLQFADFGPRRSDGPAAYLAGCNLAVRRAAFEQLGGFPAMTGEDTLLSSAAGARWPGAVRYVRDMRVSHAGRARLRAFWEHQEAFGFIRGREGLRLRPVYRRLGRRSALAAPIVLKRLVYIATRTARWRPSAMPRLVVFLPFLLLGLAGWCKGFLRGCRAAAPEAS
jgi:GT2 family glycosyltransferase